MLILRGGTLIYNEQAILTGRNSTHTYEELLLHLTPASANELGKGLTAVVSSTVCPSGSFVYNE